MKMADKNKFYFTSKYCWTDGSGFEFDGEPTNLVGFTPNSESFFSLSGKMAKNTRVGYQEWSNWIDKFQTDYRFLLLSDENAETILQPNVDDPWMFTEYIFKGIGKKYNAETKKLENIDYILIEPPLYDEESLELKNPDRVIPKDFKKSDYDKFTKFDIKNECAEYNRDRIITKDKYYVKACRTIKEDGWGEGYPVNDPGAKLYKATVNVESVKWGEHGNIPPHTLNMFAPPSWIDTKKKKIIQPITVAKIGYPIYANTNGIFYHGSDSNDYIVEQIQWDKEEGEGNNKKFYYVVLSNIDGDDILLEELKETGTLQPKGQAAGNASKNHMNLKYIQQSQNGDLIHKGCEFYIGQGGCAYCNRADENNPDYTKSLLLDKTKCMTENGNTSCPGYVKKSQKAISTYESVAQTKDQYLSATYGLYSSSEEKANSNAMLAFGTMGGLAGGMGAFLAFGVLSGLTRVYQPGLKDYTQQNVFFETSFKITEVPEENFKIIQPNKNSSKGVRVERGSGNQNIDEIIPWKGGDNYATGDADQVNFTRFTQSVMPCYNPDYCNEMCGLAMKSGYVPESRAGSKTQNSPETNSEYVDYCRYYKDKKSGVECPFDSIPKSAYEFQEGQKRGGQALKETINRWLFNYSSEIEVNTIVEEKNTMFVKKINGESREDKDDIPDHYLLYGKNDESAFFGGLNCTQKEKVKIKVPQRDEKGNYVRDEKGKIVCEDKEIEAYKICKFTLTSINPQNARIDDLFFWWTPLDNNGNKIYKNGKETIWFCKYDENLVSSTHFTHYVDNWNKFIGGDHPQYKDYSKRGREFIQEKESQMERDAMGDLGGDPEYPGIEQPKSKQGYWIDEDGEWIMEELDLGESLIYDENGKELPKSTVTLTKTNFLGQEIKQTFYLTKKEQEEFEKKNQRENITGVSLSFRKSNTVVGEDGQTQSPQTINCTVNLNDTKDLIDALYFSPPVRYDDNGNPQNMPPSVVSFSTNPDESFYALPAERYGAHCSVCDYYLNEKYGASHEDENKGMYCPWCGTRLELKPLKKLYRQKAIGQVDYWGLPGTVIDSKSYFWKNPTLINNAMLDQIKFKSLKNASKANSDSEVTNGYITEHKGYYKPIPSLEEVSKMPESERKKLWELVKDKDREDIAMYNDLINKVNTSANGFDLSDTDDRLIVPYSDVDGLKFFTLNHLKKLRQTVEPAMGYVIGKHITNPDYNRLRPTYENRNDATAPRYWVKGKCGVEPQILAANKNGSDCFIQYWSGDPEWGSVREYYPPGCTWWFLNNVIGIRYSDNKGSKCHLDDGAYSNETRSMMCCFLHGFLPLNKKILAAYAVLYPSSTIVSRQPLGKDWNGRVHYEHYHAWSRIGEYNFAYGLPHEHLGDHLHKRAGYKTWVYDNNGDMIPHSAIGEANQHCYKRVGDTWIPGEFKSDEIKYQGMIFDDNGIPHYVKKRPSKKQNISFFTENQIGEFKDDGRYPEWVTIKDKLVTKNKYQSYYDFGEEEMAEATSDLNHFFDNDWWGGGENEEPVWDYIKLQGQYEGIEGWTKWGKDIVQLKTNNEIWKQMTSEEFDEFVEYNTGHFNFYCSDGEVETSYDFDSINEELLNGFFTEQMQEIPGYFNYNGMNSAGLQNVNVSSKKPEIDEKWKDGQIIYQDDDYENNSTNSKFKLDAYKEGGNVPQVLDITKIVKNTYSKRMDCYFNCQAGKSVDEVYNLVKNREESRNDGGAFNEIERKLWNLRYSEYDGILLSDCYHYPKLNSDGKIIESTDGEKIELSTICQSNVFKCEKEFPCKINSDNNTIICYIIFSDGEEKHEEIILENIESISFSEFCSKVQTELNKVEKIKCSISVLENNRWSITFENCHSFKLNGNAISFLGGKNDTYYQVANRIVSCSSNIAGYSPINLIKGNGETCEPLSGKEQLGWRTENFINENQNFIIDLCQTPFEDSRRDWRYRSGTINCTNCYCPNSDCITNMYYAPERITVGMWAGKKNIIMGDGQTHCPACGTDLSEEKGAVITDSDGIKSYFYNEIFDYNPLITNIYIKETTDDIFKCSYNIYCQNSETGIWVCVLKAKYDKLIKKYSYWNIKGTYFSENILMFEETFRARYIKVETINNSNRVSFKNNSFEYKENVVKITGFTNIDTDCLIGQYIKFGKEEIPEWNFGEEGKDYYSIISNYVENGKLVIKTDGMIPQDVTYCRFYANKYYSGIQELEIYGIPFKKSDLTILPPADFESGNISTEGLKLSQQPIQIMNVYAGALSGGMITLNEKVISGKEPLNSIKQKIQDMYFEVEERTYPTPITKTDKDGNKSVVYLKYYDIKSGEWYHEPRSNKIYVPTKAKIGEDKFLSLSELTKNLEEHGIYLKDTISQMVVEYWNASNSGITLQATAAENGPAYQLEAESICKIKNKDVLPKCGESVELFTKDNPEITERKEIEWHCYNHVPSTMRENAQTMLGGYFKKPKFYGNELGRLSRSSASNFKKLFGEHCNKITPMCVTQVTFYGKPNSILTGNIEVYAPKENKITYTFPGSGNQTITEKTGGLEDGMFVLEIRQAENAREEKGRKSKAWGTPLIVVYAVDEEPFSES